MQNINFWNRTITDGIKTQKRKSTRPRFFINGHLYNENRKKLH